MSDNLLILVGMEVKEHCSKCWQCWLQWHIPKHLVSNVPPGYRLVCAFCCCCCVSQLMQFSW